MINRILLALAWSQTQTTAPEQQGARTASDPAWWKVIVAISVVITILAGSQQLISLIQRRRLRRAEERLLEIAASQLDAESAKAEAATYEALKRTLRDQVDNELPIEARRIFISNRLEQLRESIGDQYEEYERLERELGQLASVTPLDQRIRDVISARISPLHLRRQRRERIIVASVGFLVLLSLSPVSLGFFVQRYFELLEEPDDELLGNVITAVLVGAAAVSIGVWALIRFSASRLGWRPAFRHMVSIGILIWVGGVATLIAGLQSRQHAVTLYNNSEDFNVVYHRLRSASAWSSTWLHSSTVLVGIGGAFLLSALVAWRRKRFQSKGSTAVPPPRP